MANLFDRGQGSVSERRTECRRQLLTRRAQSLRCVILNTAQQWRAQSARFRLQALSLVIREQDGLTVRVQESESRDAAEIHARDELLERLLPWVGTSFVNHGVSSQSRQGRDIEVAPFCVYDHMRGPTRRLGVPLGHCIDARQVCGVGACMQTATSETL